MDSDKKEEDEMPEAVAEEDEAKANGGDDSKEEEKGDDKKEKEPMFKRIPKDDPGEHWNDQFPDKVDPRGEPTEIAIKWDKEVRDKKQADTQHMLFLIQEACDLHRRRVIERNKYFKSISRSDRYIDHVDTPQIITNFLKWHNEDKEKNVLLGSYLTEKPKLFMINDMISDIGGVKKGPATRIYSKLKKEVMIDLDPWTQNNAKLKLKTWGMKKFYAAEKVLDECTVEEVVTLFTYRAPDEEKGDKQGHEVDWNVVDGVFAQFEGKGGKGLDHLNKVEDWRGRVVAFIRENKLDGKKIIETKPKLLTTPLKTWLVADDVVNDAGKQANKVLTGPCGRLLTICKRMPAHKVLVAAAAANGDNGSAAKPVVEEKDDQ